MKLVKSKIFSYHLRNDKQVKYENILSLTLTYSGRFCFLAVLLPSRRLLNVCFYILYTAYRQHNSSNTCPESLTIVSYAILLILFFCSFLCVQVSCSDISISYPFATFHEHVTRKTTIGIISRLPVPIHSIVLYHIP